MEVVDPEVEFVYPLVGEFDIKKFIYNVLKYLRTQVRRLTMNDTGEIIRIRDIRYERYKLIQNGVFTLALEGRFPSKEKIIGININFETTRFGDGVNALVIDVIHPFWKSKRSSSQLQSIDTLFGSGNLTKACRE